MQKVYMSLTIQNNIKSSKQTGNFRKTIKPLTLEFDFYYISTTTFGHLMEYIISISQLDICPCYIFYYDKFQIDTTETINILDKYITGGIIAVKRIYLSLILKKCTCSSSILKFLKYSKYDLLISYADNVQEYEDKIEKLNNELKELKNNNVELEKDIKVLKYAVKGDFATLDKLKEAGLASDLKPKNILKVDPNTKQIKGNINDYQNNKNANNEVIFEDFYDVIIDIKSVSDINCKKGWKIKMNKRGKNNYEVYKKKNVLKIGVIGNANKGKSYILSRISKIDLPSGTSIRTEGLSIKYPELKKFKDRIIALLDSAGLETPVLREKEKNSEISKELFKEKSREKIITELFLQNYIINNSDILILVVGILTYSEQKLINRIKTEITRAKIVKPLFIIHNLITYVDKKEVQNYIENYLLKSATFKLVKGHKVSTEYKEKDEDEGIYYHEENSNLKIFHLIFANEDSEAGKYYNSFTLNFLENSYQQQVTDISKFDVIESLKERFVNISKEIIDNADNIKKENFEINKENCLILKNIEEIQLKKCLIDELGFSNLKGSGFEPNYNYYKDGNKIVIRVEVPGNCSLEPSLDYSGEYTIIRLKGNKKEDKAPKNKEDNLHITREFGQFTLDIPLKSEDYILSNKPPNIEKKNGVFIISFDLDNKTTLLGYTTKEEEEI